MSRSHTDKRRQTTSVTRPDIDADPPGEAVVRTASGWCRIEMTGTGVAVLELHRDHDLGTMDELTSAFEALGSQEGDVVLDFSNATFVDSAVIHAIYGFGARQTQAGRRLVLQVGPESTVRRVLEFAGLLDQLHWAEDRESAITMLSKG
jgi:anti-anti-sigma factor